MMSTTELDERIFKCRKILEEDPNSQIFAALAESHRKKGELDKAFRVCQNGLKVHPSYGSAHVVMAKINLDRGLYDWAEIEARKAMELDGRTRTLELLLAEIYIYKGEFDRAIKLLMQLHQTDPNNDQIQRLLDIARKLPEESRAIIGPRHGDADPQTGIVALDPPTVDSDDSLNVREILDQATAVPAVKGALFVNAEGLVIDARWSLKMDQARCGATIGELGNELNQSLLEGSFGAIRSILVETDGPTFYILRQKDGAFIFVGDESCNLGTLRMKIEKLVANYRP